MAHRCPPRTPTTTIPSMGPQHPSHTQAWFNGLKVPGEKKPFLGWYLQGEESDWTTGCLHVQLSKCCQNNMNGGKGGEEGGGRGYLVLICDHRVHTSWCVNNIKKHFSEEEEEEEDDDLLLIAGEIPFSFMGRWSLREYMHLWLISCSTSCVKNCSVAITMSSQSHSFKEISWGEIRKSFIGS